MRRSSREPRRHSWPGEDQARPAVCMKRIAGHVCHRALSTSGCRTLDGRSRRNRAAAGRLRPIGGEQDLVRRVDLAALPDEISAAARDTRLAALPRVDRT